MSGIAILKLEQIRENNIGFILLEQIYLSHIIWLPSEHTIFTPKRVIGENSVVAWWLIYVRHFSASNNAIAEDVSILTCTCDIVVFFCVYFSSCRKHIYMWYRWHLYKTSSSHLFLLYLGASNLHVGMKHQWLSEVSSLCLETPYLSHVITVITVIVHFLLRFVLLILLLRCEGISISIIIRIKLYVY